MRTSRSSRPRADAYPVWYGPRSGRTRTGRLMTISEEPHGRIHVLLLSGGLDGSTCGALASRIDALVAYGRAQLLLDCGGLASFSSAGLLGLLCCAELTEAACGVSVLLSAVVPVPGGILPL